MFKKLFVSLITIFFLWGVVSSTVTSSAVAATIMVDSTADTDDGSCGLPSGDCTLREAINAVNDGVGKKIEFDSATFPPD